MNAICTDFARTDFIPAPLATKRGRPGKGMEPPVPVIRLVEQPVHLEAQAGQQLWCSVLAMALADATGQVACPQTGGRDQAMREAKAWFRRGDDDFRQVCELAGLDPAVVRDFALKVMAGSGPKHSPFPLQTRSMAEVGQ